MPCDTLLWTLEQKQDISGKTDGIWQKSGVGLIVMFQCWVLHFAKSRGNAIRYQNQGKLGEGDTAVLCVIFATFL